MMEYEHEPIRGLPGDLPAGEEILWQGSPDWRVFARSALFVRAISIYFVVIGVFSIISGSMQALGLSVVGGLIVLGLFYGFAMLVARTTVYTLTNRRIVLRIGVALNKCINLPLKVIGSADLRGHAGDAGDIALTITQTHRLGYAMLWPHARPFCFGDPQPMLRAVPDAAKVAKLLADACAALMQVDRHEQVVERTNGGFAPPMARLQEAQA